MSAAWRRYLYFHLSFVLFAIGFAAWAIAMRRLFPEGYYDCFLNDVLHLYCPLCGGTRAFLSLLRLDLAAALRYNPGVLLAVLPALALEIRALWLLFAKKEGQLYPRYARRATAVYLVAYALLRNTALFFGADLLRDQTAYWQARVTPLRAAFFLPLATLFCICFWLAAYPPKRLVAYRFFITCAAALLPVLIYTLLQGRAVILLFELPVLAVLILTGLSISNRKKEKKSC